MPKMNHRRRSGPSRFAARLPISSAAFDGSSTAPEEKIYFDPHFPYELVNRSSFVDLIAARAAAYRREYDAVPEFRAGIHGGPVVVAQCGDFNQEIVYFGDTANTAARVQQRCKDVGRPLLGSGPIKGISKAGLA